MNSKKSIIALLLVAIIGVAGLTIAYFTNTTSVENEFNTNPYGTTVVEEFVSPTNWTPGTTTDKTLTVTNSGSVDEAVRISYIETWTSANSNTEGDLSLTQNNNRAAIIHFTNTDDWTLSNGYYYYNYKLAPNETTSELLDYVTFNPAITNDEDCDTTINNETTTITCNSSGDGYDGATYKLTFTIETVQYDKYNEAWELNNSVTILEAKPQPQTAAQYLVNNATNVVGTVYDKDNLETKGKMFQFTHGEGANAVTESRYIGNEPNNYVYFNCDAPVENQEYNYADSCETWRILGIFDVDDGNGNVEQRMKLLRGNSIKHDYWNTAKNSNNGYNDWTDASATLKLFLNGIYYDDTESSTKYDYDIKESARNMIGDAVYYLGAFVLNSSFTTEQLYNNERGNTTCASCGGATYKLTWTGKVGLMYPSDMYMTYKGVNEACYNTPTSSDCNITNAEYGWVYNSRTSATWFLSPHSSDTNAVFLVGYSSGYLSVYDANTSTLGVRPVVYLKSNIKIADGTGEVGSPYVLELIQ